MKHTLACSGCNATPCACGKTIYRFVAVFSVWLPDDQRSALFGGCVDKVMRSCRDTSLDNARDRLIRRMRLEYDNFTLRCITQLSLKGKR